MNKLNIILTSILLLTVAVIGWQYYSKQHTSNSNIPNNIIPRDVVQVPLSFNSQSDSNMPSVGANKLPQFVLNLTGHKFDTIINDTSNSISQLAKVAIVHSVYANSSLNVDISVDKEKKQLIIKPQDPDHFIPGLYKLSLKLRTLEGEVDINQDFTWGVIAVNTNKSIFSERELAQIGIGVLNDKGVTLCKTGLFNKVDDVSMVITDPQGINTDFSLKDNTIKDSEKCGPNTVTNQADFQANYTTTVDGIYQMKVTAVVYGKLRTIVDYFKVDSQAKFDVERTSFPTRIYPKAPYPSTFTVTAVSNYNGTVEDEVPSFFTIEDISDNGQLTKDGNFTKIIWNTDLKAGVPKTFTYIIKFPMVSPEFYLIGPIKIGDFKEARQWQVASDAINSDTGVFTAEDNSGTNTWYRNWTGTAWSPAPPTAPSSMSSGTGPADSRWFKEISNPQTGDKLIAIIDNPSTLWVFRWNGSTWAQEIQMTMSTAVTSTEYMDIAYEQLSGNALLVYCDASLTAPANNTVRYIRRVGSTWDHSGTFASSVPTAIGTATTPKSWVRLVPQANSDNILVGYLDTSNFIGGFIWNGDANGLVPGSEIVDNAGTTASGHTHEAFAMAWETNSQAAMIAWANGASDITYRRYTGGAWASEATAGLSFAANADWVSASADDSPSSNKIAFGTQNVGGAGSVGCDFTIWNGSTWQKYTSTTPTCLSDSFQRSINVAFEHGTGQAVWAYVPSGAGTALSYQTWKSGTFGTIGTIPGTVSNQIRTVQLYSDPNTLSIICLFTTTTAGATGNVGVLDTEWNGTSWTTLPTLANALFGNVATTTDNQSEEAFGFGFDLNLETQAAYRWFADLPGTDTSVSTALTFQDTPYTLTTAGQKFRLRMLLYYPDVLATGTRSYILQYVDPGSGTCSAPNGGTPADWATVPNVNDTSSTIAYYDNSTVASASAVTVNGSLDPTYNGATKIAETYNEQNTFTTNNALTGGQVGLYDFSLIDKTTFGRIAHNFCFRVIRSTGVPLKINKYPQITTASLNDVLIQGNTTIRGNTTIK